MTATKPGLSIEQLHQGRYTLLYFGADTVEMLLESDWWSQLVGSPVHLAYHPNVDVLGERCAAHAVTFRNNPHVIAPDVNADIAAQEHVIRAADARATQPGRAGWSIVVMTPSDVVVVVSGNVTLTEHCWIAADGVMLGPLRRASGEMLDCMAAQFSTPLRQSGGVLFSFASYWRLARPVRPAPEVWQPPEDVAEYVVRGDAVDLLRDGCDGLYRLALHISNVLPSFQAQQGVDQLCRVADVLDDLEAEWSRLEDDPAPEVWGRRANVARFVHLMGVFIRAIIDEIAL